VELQFRRQQVVLIAAGEPAGPLQFQIGVGRAQPLAEHESGAGIRGNAPEREQPSAAPDAGSAQSTGSTDALIPAATHPPENALRVAVVCPLIPVRPVQESLPLYGPLAPVLLGLGAQDLGAGLIVGRARQPAFQLDAVVRPRLSVPLPLHHGLGAGRAPLDSRRLPLRRLRRAVVGLLPPLPRLVLPRVVTRPFVDRPPLVGADVPFDRGPLPFFGGGLLSPDPAGRGQLPAQGPLCATAGAFVFLSAAFIFPPEAIGVTREPVLVPGVERFRRGRPRERSRLPTAGGNVAPRQFREVERPDAQLGLHPPDALAAQRLQSRSEGAPRLPQRVADLAGRQALRRTARRPRRLLGFEPNLHRRLFDPFEVGADLAQIGFELQRKKIVSACRAHVDIP
jgi:hypothetical protein